MNDEPLVEPWWRAFETQPDGSVTVEIAAEVGWLEARFMPDGGDHATVEVVSAPTDSAAGFEYPWSGWVAWRDEGVAIAFVCDDAMSIDAVKVKHQNVWPNEDLNEGSDEWWALLALTIADAMVAAEF